MKIIEKDNNGNAEFGVVLEESASALTQGPRGRFMEGRIHPIGEPPLQ